MDNKTEELLYGKKKKLTLPSKHYVVIREQNGADDDLISNQSLAEDLSNIDMFLSSLILETDLPFANANKKLDKKSMREMLIKDKYFVLFASRIHSMGSEVRFTFKWAEGEDELEYTEDLNIFVWDYTKPFPKEGDEEYREEMIEPYEDNPYNPVEATLTSGKQIRFERLNGKSEKYLMGLDEITRNAIYKARGLEQFYEDKWQKVTNFMYFSKKDMAELNKIVKAADPEFTGSTKLENPKTKQVIDYPIMRAESFFYPEEI